MTGARRSSGVTVSGFASTVTSSASGNAASRRSSASGAVNVGVPPPRNTVSSAGREHAALQLELGQEGVHICAVLIAPPDRGDEVAVSAAVRAERQVHVEVADAAIPPSARPRRRPLSVCQRHYLFSWSRLSTARNASCGTSTEPTCFIRFLPFFCCSSSFRLREMSPP